VPSFRGTAVKSRHEPIGGFAELEGRDIPGGCKDCDAFQRLVKKDDEGVWDLTTFHDNSCPFFLARKAELN
jgi:hypothetical protein